MNKAGYDLPDRGIYHGNSMSNIFVDGDILFFSDVSFDSLECGDVVTVFERSPYYVHRIVRKTGDYAITMGDNNLRPDALKLKKDCKFRCVSNYAPVRSPNLLLPVKGGHLGMRQFHRQQRIRRTTHLIWRIMQTIRWMGFFRVPAKKETKFRDGTIQWSFGNIPVAARTPSGQTKYLSTWKRLFFRVTKGTATPLNLDKSGQDEDRETKQKEKET